MDQPWDWDALLNTEPPAPPRSAMFDTVARVLEVNAHDTVAQGAESAHRWVGRLRLPANDAIALLTPAFARAGYTALLQEAEGEQVAVIASPGLVRPSDSRLWLALLLFVATLLSTFITGGLQGGAGDSVQFNWVDGLLFSGSLMSILLAHELGHYVASRRLGVAVSYPFFIPAPVFLVFGTMGAFIQMKEPPPDRRALFTIGVAGPLAGLALAIPVTLLGLMLSTVAPLPTGGGYILEGNSLLYGALKWLVFGQWLPGNGVDVMLHPMAFAGWAGLLVTALNLLPAGQLDGGHVVFGLLGRRWGRRVTFAVIGLLAVMGFYWSGWWLWAAMIYFMAGRHAPILNEITPLDRRQRAVGILTLVLFILLFTPTPLTILGG